MKGSSIWVCSYYTKFQDSGSLMEDKWLKRSWETAIYAGKFNSIPFTYPKITNLSKHRVNLVRLFLHTRFDDTGHLWVHEQDQQIQVYIIIFTCLEVRMVYLEQVEDISVHSFISAFIWFLNMCGISSHLCSDNAKSFITEYDLLHQALTSSEFEENFGSCIIKHVSIPVHSAWYGGVWKWVIKALKACLYKTLLAEPLTVSPIFCLTIQTSNVQWMIDS